MDKLHADLAQLARAIVQQSALPAQVTAHYAHYPQQTGIGVYRNNYRGNLHDALGGAYPVVLQLVGAEFFRMLAARFIEHTPSHSANLHHYGAGLADFIRTFAPARELVYLADIAALEWAAHTAYFAADTPAFDFAQLAAIPAQQHARLVFELHPAVRVLHSPYPVLAIWQAHQPGAAADFEIDLASGPCIALVCRPHQHIAILALEAAEAAWLQFTAGGQALGPATGATLELHPHFDLQNTLSKLVQHAVLSGFRIPD